MRAVGEYLMYKPIAQTAEILLKLVLGEVPDWQQDKWRKAAAEVDMKRLQDRHAELLRTELSVMELESLLKMLRLERSSAPADAAELQAMKFTEYAGEVRGREQAAFGLLLKAYREMLHGACLALGLGC
jgi:hypothetical protein